MHTLALVTATNNVIDQYNSNGFNLNIGSGLVNANNIAYTSWTFRKAPGFFDYFTFSGDNTTSRNISHNLGSLPGFILIKRTDSAGNWYCVNKYNSTNYGIGDNSNDLSIY